MLRRLLVMCNFIVILFLGIVFTNMNIVYAATINSFDALVTNPDVHDQNVLRVGDTVKAIVYTVGEGGPINSEIVDYQWYREDKPILGATQETYTLQKDDEGKNVCVEIIGKGNISGSRKSAKRFVDNTLGFADIINQRGFSTMLHTTQNLGGVITEYDDNYVGDTLEVVLENKYQEGKVNYQWYRVNSSPTLTINYIDGDTFNWNDSDIEKISNATSKVYKITDADYDKMLVCRVTAKSDSGLTGTSDTYLTYYSVVRN